jgi:hypothetical protein
MELTPQRNDEVFEDWWRNVSMRVPGHLDVGISQPQNNLQAYECQL